MKKMDERRDRTRKAFQQEIWYDILAEESGRMINKEFTATGIQVSSLIDG